MDIEPSEVIETLASPVDTTDGSEKSLQSPVEVSERGEIYEEMDCLKSEVNKLMCANT